MATELQPREMAQPSYRARMVELIDQLRDRCEGVVLATGVGRALWSARAVCGTVWSLGARVAIQEFEILEMEVFPHVRTFD